MNNKIIPSEYDEAISLNARLKYNNYNFTHIGNESGLPSHIARIVAIKKKKQGTSPGFPDYCILLKRKSLLFIELKRQRRRLKSGKLGKSPSKTPDAQKERIKMLNEIPNVAACFCFGAREAIDTIQDFESK